MSWFLKVKVVQVARGQNRHVEFLAMLTLSMTKEVPRIIKVELVAKPRINAMVATQYWLSANHNCTGGLLGGRIFYA